MRCIFLGLLLAVSAPVVAQKSAPAREVQDRPSVPQYVLAALGGHSAGALTAVAGGFVVAAAGESSEAGLLVGIGLYPLGVAAATYGIGELFGTDGGFPRTVRGSYIGAAIGAGVGFTLGAAILSRADDEPDEASEDDPLFEELGVVAAAFAVGAVFYIGGTLVGASLGYNASLQPVVLRHVDGQAVPAARLTLSF